MTEREKVLTEALRAMLSEFGRTCEQAWDDVPLTQAEVLAEAALIDSEGTALAPSITGLGHYRND